MQQTLTNLQRRQDAAFGTYGSMDSVGRFRKGPDPWEKERQNLSNSVFVGAHLPSLLFIILVGLFTYTSHILPVLPWVVALIGSVALLIGSYPSAPQGLTGRKSTDWIPLGFCAVAITLGILCGVWNVTIIEAWTHATYLNHHHGVLADANPLSVSDGGILDFAKGTSVDTESAAGYQAWPNTYCAAPITKSNSDDGGSARIGFWAVGMNCCDPRGRFFCDDAQVAKASSGLLVNSHPLGAFTGHDVNAYYKSAVRMAAAEYGLEVSENPVLVRWLKDPVEAANWSFKVSGIIFCALIILAFASCWGMQMLYINIGQAGG